MQVSFGTKVIANPKQLIRATDSYDMKMKLLVNIRHTKEFTKTRLVSRVFGEDSFVYERGKGKNFKIFLTQKDKNDKVISKDVAYESHTTDMAIGDYDFAEDIALRVCIKLGIAPFWSPLSWRRYLVDNIDKVRSALN